LRSVGGVVLAIEYGPLDGDFYLEIILISENWKFRCSNLKFKFKIRKKRQLSLTRDFDTLCCCCMAKRLVSLSLCLSRTLWHLRISLLFNSSTTRNNIRFRWFQKFQLWMNWTKRVGHSKIQSWLIGKGKGMGWVGW